MSRRLLLLSGLSILAVVVAHASIWGETAMFHWASLFGPAAVPDLSQDSSLTYYALLVLRQLSSPAVPAFLFISAFFVAYAAKGAQTAFNRKALAVRLTNLLVPYLIWSSVTFASEILLGIHYSPGTYVQRLVVGAAVPAYFFVPLLCQFYLLAPRLVEWAKAHWKRTLLTAAIIQWGFMFFTYLDAFGFKSPLTSLVLTLTPSWIFVRWIFFFTFGLVAAFHLEDLRRFLNPFRWWIFGAMVVFVMLTVIEGEVDFRLLGLYWRGSALFLSSSLYAITFILCFLAFDSITLPFPVFLSRLGSKTYGIYLLHSKLLEIGAKTIVWLIPWLVASQAIFLLSIVVFAVGVPLLVMQLVAMSPLRRSYRYLFG